MRLLPLLWPLDERVMSKLLFLGASDNILAPLRNVLVYISGPLGSIWLYKVPSGECKMTHVLNLQILNGFRAVFLFF